MNITKRYRVGIDVGTNSLGFCAVEMGDDDLPTSLLNSVVYMHDSGVDPEKAKVQMTRLATAGVARRTRKLIARRRKRLRQLDDFLTDLGWPLPDLAEFSDPYTPWKVRARLAEERLAGREQREALAIAVRHMARHRGWRSPYDRIVSLYSKKPDSKLFSDLKERVTERSGVVFDEGVTPAQVVCDLGLSPNFRLRSAPGKTYGSNAVREGRSIAGEAKEGVLGGKLMQSDNANELRRIGEVQGLSEDLVKQLIDRVFAAETPKGQAGKRAKRDELPGQHSHFRAPKAHPEFQKFRIISVVSNLRIKDNQATIKRELTSGEKNIVIKFLMSVDGSDGITWGDVSEKLGISRAQLSGTAERSAEGERPSSFPPVNTTNRRICESKVEPLKKWWKNASGDSQAALVTALSNADELDGNAPGAEDAENFLASLTDEELEKLDNISLPAGRAAYSVDSLRRLNDRMINDAVDLYEARKREFGVDKHWIPPIDAIGEPVGNPSVDRVLKIVNRWLMAAIRQWGPPESINIEHVRSGFSSALQVREYERELDKRAKRNKKVLEEAQEKYGIKAEMRRSDITRFIAIRRQNCQCAYCGETITFESCEMDHIVPRMGTGSTNTRDNLVATCQRCNRSKSNTPFAVWAACTSIPNVSLDEAKARVREWIDDPGLTKIQNRNFKKDVIERLSKTSKDDPIDNRSIESVAWMARELAERIRGHVKKIGAETRIAVFRGSITAEARKASGFEGKVELIGGKGKTRLDRRHHAMDAATIALMRSIIAQILAERSNLREGQRLRNDHETWKDYRGKEDGHRIRFGQWLNQMNRLTELFNDALSHDRIPVMQNTRLRLGNGEAHEATIQRFVKKRVGERWSLKEIDSASSPAMWCALTRDPEFDQKEGLPENLDREIRVKNEWFAAEDNLCIFKTNVAAIAVRGGYAEIGNTIHHARIYRIPEKRPKYGMIRVFSCDLLHDKGKNLFSIPLKPQSISLRTANPKTRKAVLNGTAEYIGWLVHGTELELDFRDLKSPSAIFSEFFSDFPGTYRWRIVGFEDSTIINLRPVYLAAEGLKNIEHSNGSKSIIDLRSWRISIGSLFKTGGIRIIRRNALGNPRLSSSSGLPVCIQLKE